MSEDFAVPNYKLSYFPLRGRAEYIRYIFALAEVPYEEDLITFQDWPSKKADLPFNSLPLLTINNGKHVVNQSAAIGRLLAKRFGIAGQNAFEQALVDSYVDGLIDLSGPYGKVTQHLIAGNMQLANSEFQEFKDKSLNAFLDRYENFINSNTTRSGWLVGDRVTWADVAVGEFLDKLNLFDVDLLYRYPSLERLVKRLHALPGIKRRLEERPADWKI